MYYFKIHLPSAECNSVCMFVYICAHMFVGVQVCGDFRLVISVLSIVLYLMSSTTSLIVPRLFLGTTLNLELKDLFNGMDSKL